MKKKTTAKKSKTVAKAATKPSTKSTGDWREATLNRMRQLIRTADPQIVEEVKWRKPSNGMKGVPVWSHEGILCTGETYKEVVKLTFMHGAELADPSRLFNSSLEGNARRAIDIREGKKVNEGAFKALIQQAVAVNGGSNAKSAKRGSAKKAPAAKSAKIKLAKKAK